MTRVPIDSLAVRERLAAVARKGIGSSGVAVVTDTGATVAGRGPDKPLAPASTMKILTSLAALDTLGADHTFSTRVVREPGGRVVLVGGGDPLLTDKTSAAAAKPASLEALARATASALKASGVKKVSLGYDDSLFTGPDFNPAWTKKWHTFLARVSPLTVGEGLYNPWQADQKPARTAASAFAARLEARGITVTRVTSAAASGAATEVASVQSAPLSTIVARTLRLSDNHAAEVLARQVAIATGEEPSFTGGTRAVKAWLVAHDLWDDGMRLLDGSGLSSRSRVTPSVLARAVALSLDTDSLSTVARALPVAGRSGTLKDRFNDSSERIGRGNVHAKTGTLPGIGALAGYLSTQDGTRLVFAVMANDAVGQTTTQNFLDRTAATLVRCGCAG
ncbi:D-alanyl-D-alanine carboxypeptidase/D-alanyl-D-alanine-endopeptidase [Propionicimonas sp.]|uniref:D-alanyl-D-alanine carboxypeptidase/D-alanyl-D-alanine endopeptidase n=1 Tax=Propionicimonas sp. TaxID=1955623 RepID=UPI0039E37446